MLLFWPGHPARISIIQAHLVTVHSSSAWGIKKCITDTCTVLGVPVITSHGSGALYFHFGLEPNTTVQLAPHPKAVWLVPTFKWVPDVFKLIITSGVDLTPYSITLPCFMVLTACITIWNCFLGSFVYFLAPLPKLEWIHFERSKLISHSHCTSKTQNSVWYWWTQKSIEGVRTWMNEWTTNHITCSRLPVSCVERISCKGTRLHVEYIKLCLPGLSMCSVFLWGYLGLYLSSLS